MPVTEFALLPTRSSRGDDLEFLETLMQIQEVQDAWTRLHQPHNLAAGENLSSMYAERSGPQPPSLLITAPWDSPEAHAEWARSDANQAAMAKLSRFLAPGCGSVLLFHLEPAGTGSAQMRGPFVHKDGRDWFDVCRMTVTRDQREGVQSAYRALEDELRGAGLGQSIWAGWRIETAGEEEELVVFWRNGDPREKLEELLSRSENRDHRQFMHVV